MRLRKAYWELKSYEDLRTAGARDLLRERQFYAPSNARLAHLRELVRRSDRGLLSYEAYSTKLLRRFLEARGINHSTSPDKKALVATLEQSDDQATFRRFLELPAELRNRIYELHLVNVSLERGRCGRPSDSYLLTPAQPFHSRTSRDIRAEVLAVFYEKCRFLIHFRTVNFRGKLRMRDSTWRFFNATRPEHIARMHHFSIYLQYRGLQFDLDIERRTERCRVKCVSPDQPRGLETPLEVQTALEVQLFSIGSTIAQRPGSEK